MRREGFLMRLAVLFCTLALASLANAKVSVAIAPAVTRAAVPSQLEAPMGKAVAEMLSWELSAMPSIKVTDPASAASALPNADRSELGEAEIADAESAQRRLGVDAFVLPRISREGSDVQVEAVLAISLGARSQSYKWVTRGPDNQILPLVRQAVLALADSLQIQLPGNARQLLTQTQGSSWDIVELFAKGIDAEDAGRQDDALAFYHEAQSRGAMLPAMLVRMKKLEATLNRR
jgi:hypothetical protein